VSPLYLVRQQSSWCFRIRVPDDLRGKIGKKELRYSLKTGSIGEAKIKARRAASGAQLLFSRLRKDKGVMDELSGFQIQEMLEEYIRRSLEDEEEMWINTNRPLNPDEVSEGIEALEYVLSDLKEALASADHRHAERIADELLDEKGLRLDKDSPTYKKFCREILKAQIEALEIVLKRRHGDYSGEPIYSSTTGTPAERRQSARLNEIIKGYWNENIKAGNWAERTKVEYERCIRFMLWILGDPPVHTVNHQRMRTFKEGLLKLPANLSSRKYAGKTVAEVLKTDSDKKMAVSTVNKYLGFAIGVFNYAVRNNHIPSNPAQGLQITKKKRKRGASDRRAVFTVEDLEKLFQSKEYTQDDFSYPHQFWVPLLGLFTGARLEELCQLYIEDVQLIDGIWVLDINEKSPDKKLKTADSKRQIPIHPFLVEELQFPAFVEKVKRQDYDRVWPELKKINHRYSHYVSRWFTAYRKSCGVTEERKAFHSFRHTFSNYLKQNDFERSMCKQLVGHTDSDMTFGVYGKKYGVQKLYSDVVSKIDFGIDLNHLKGSNYVKN